MTRGGARKDIVEKKKGDQETLHETNIGATQGENTADEPRTMRDRNIGQAEEFGLAESVHPRRAAGGRRRRSWPSRRCNTV